MKPRTLTWVPTLTLLTVLAIPVRLAAAGQPRAQQETQASSLSSYRHRYVRWGAELLQLSQLDR